MEEGSEETCKKGAERLAGEFGENSEFGESAQTLHAHSQLSLSGHGRSGKG